MSNILNNDPTQDHKKIIRFSVGMQIAFLAAVCVFSFVYALGIAGSAGFMLVPIAAALDFLYAMNAKDSAAKLLLLLLVNLIPFVAAAVYFVSVAAALPALFPLIMALPIWLTVRRGAGRSVSIAAATVCAVILYAIMFAISVVEQFGELNADTVVGALDMLFAPIKEMFLSALAEFDGESALNITESDIDAVIYYVKTMLFGVISACMIVWAYLTTVAVRVGAKLMNMTHILPHGVRIGMRMSMTDKGPHVEVSREAVMWRIEIDSVSAVIFIASYLASILFGSSDTLALPAIVAVNLVLILAPGFLYCGTRDFLLGFSGKSSIGRSNKFILIPAIILIFINPMLIFMLLCVMGVIVTFRENSARRRIEKNGKEQK